MAGTDPDAAFKLDSSCAWMYDGYGADFVYGYVLMNLGLEKTWQKGGTVL